MIKLHMVQITGTRPVSLNILILDVELNLEVTYNYISR